MILRHDRPDADCLVDEEDWPAVVTFFGGDGGGTLIAGRWGLTGAHTAANIPPGHRITVAGRETAIVRTVGHPGLGTTPLASVDLALVELATPIIGIPLPAHQEKDDEVGREVLLLGRGDFGNGEAGVLGVDHRLRCVTNRVDSSDARWLRLKFDRPPDCTDLEGVGGEGDSGGPAMARGAGVLWLVGVSSWQDHAGPLGTYGCVEHYARVSPHVAWIRATMQAPPSGR